MKTTRTMWAVQDEIERIERMHLLSRAERDRLQAPLLSTLKSMRDIQLIQAGRGGEVRL
jgi:hypothetical protein